MYHFESVVTDGDVGDVADVLAHDLGLLATVRPNSLHARAKQFKVVVELLRYVPPGQHCLQTTFSSSMLSAPRL